MLFTTNTMNCSSCGSVGCYADDTRWQDPPQARLSRARKNTSYMVEIRTPAKIIESSSSEKLLGCTIHQDMKWAEHIQDNEDSLLRALNTRLNALKQLSKIAGFKTRKMVADGIFMSKLIYLIVLWGGCTKELSHAL